MPERLRGYVDEADLILSAHSHKPRIERDAVGRLWVNPGETSGWTYRKPPIALIETDPLEARIVWLPELPPAPE